MGLQRSMAASPRPEKIDPHDLLKTYEEFWSPGAERVNMEITTVGSGYPPKFLDKPVS
jgi:hypothetical protein